MYTLAAVAIEGPLEHVEVTSWPQAVMAIGIAIAVAWICTTLVKSL